jgi:hypothetical protein
MIMNKKRKLKRPGVGWDKQQLLEDKQQSLQEINNNYLKLFRYLIT